LQQIPATAVAFHAAGLAVLGTLRIPAPRAIPIGRVEAAGERR
jgi:hypothetical protein